MFKESIEKAEPGIYSILKVFKFYIFFLFLRAFKGLYMIDFIQYKFYERNRYGRKKFIEYQSLHRLMDAVNSKDTNIVFDNKSIFNKRFSKFLNRDWISVKDVTFEEFEKFMKDHDRIFFKPEIASFGDGVEILTCDDDLSEAYKRLKRSEAIGEEIVIQAEELAEFNDTSLNTLRVVTLIDKNGKSNIMFALLRTGRKGKIADNFHHYGIASKIDIETGYICTTGVDREFQRYTIHPDSKKPIVGFKIPEWDAIKEFAIELSQQVKETRYVGWDIAIDKDYNICCIEGNRGADPDVTQVTDQMGKYYDVMKMI